MAYVNPAALLRRAATDRIGAILRRRQDALNPGNILPPNDRGGLTGSGGPTLNTIPNVGQFGTPGSLPTDPGPIDPPILTDGPNNTSPPPVNSNNGLWTRLDPGMGPLPPSRQINPGDPNSPQMPWTGPGGSVFGLGLSPLPGENWLGGGFTGIDPNTNRPVYNPLGYGPMSNLEGGRYVGGGPNGGGNFSMGAPPPTPASKAAGHRASWWVF